MNNRGPIAISIALIAAMLAASLWVWHLIPPGTPIPIHWDAFGKPNGFARAPLGLFMAPAMAALIVILFIAIPAIEPRRMNLLRSAKFYHAVWIGVVLLMAVVHTLALYSALHAGVQVGGIVIPAVCLLVIVIGNYLGKTRSMFLGGIRTPWSLTSEYSWQRTNSLAGKLFMLAGMAGFVAVFMMPLMQAVEILVSALLAACVISVVMSYVYWQRDPDRQTGDIAPG
jgi:uncharacterized membrane protein